MAIMVTPKLANLPDVTTTTPSDGQVLTYDTASGKWINEDAASGGVTDHGALTGLADDDHSQYLLATGSRTGASSAAQTFTAGVSLPVTTTSTTGIIFKGANRFIHDFSHPTGNTQVPYGLNVFVGSGSGNFTLGSTATNQLHGSFNVVVGANSMTNITTGYFNVGMGYQTLVNLTTGTLNLAIGNQSQRDVTTGSGNVGVGGSSLTRNTGSQNVAIGDAALYGKIAGDGNVAIGYNAGRFQSNGLTELTGEAWSIYIGYSTRGGPSNNETNAIVIGNQAIGGGSNTTVIGATSATAATIYGAGKFWLRSSATNAVTNIGTLTHNSTGTPAAGFGAGLLFQLETSTTEDTDAAQIAVSWSDATHATRTGDIVFSTVSGGAALAEKLRLTGAGILKFSGTMGDSTKTVGTDAPADWVQIDIGGTTYYLPAYAA